MIYCNELYLTKCQKCGDQIPHSNLRCCLNTGRLLDSKMPLTSLGLLGAASRAINNPIYAWDSATPGPQLIQNPSFFPRIPCFCCSKGFGSPFNLPCKLGPSHRGSGAKWEPSWTREHVWPALVPESSIVDQLNPNSSNLAVEYLSGSFQCISGLFLWSLDLMPCSCHFTHTANTAEKAGSHDFACKVGTSDSVSARS